MLQHVAPVPDGFSSRCSIPVTMTSTISPKIQSQIERFLHHVYQHNGIQIVHITLLPASPHKGYIILTADGNYFVLKTSPSRSTNLLRYEEASPASEAYVLELITRAMVNAPYPRLLSSSNSSNSPLSGPYLLRSYISGVPLSTVAHKFTTYDRAQLDNSIGSHMRAAINHSNSMFGTVSKVAKGDGTSTWLTAFHQLLESALRDAEDQVITLPYESIRYWVGVNLPYLNAVREPRLVPLRAGTPETVLVDESRKMVTGILSWGDCLWGDPMLGEVFADASDNFWGGFGGRQRLQYGDGSDERRGHIYTVYRSIISVVKHHSRPRLGVNESEIRRVLNAALQHLAT